MNFTQYSNQKKHMQQQEQVQQQAQVPCEEFSSMGFGSVSCASLTASSASTTSSNLSGWGNVASRKSYVCLASLGEDNTTTQAETLPKEQSRPIYKEVQEQGPTWGYFVDVSGN